MEIEESSIPVGSSKSSQGNEQKLTGQMIIALHGSRKMGKTSIIHKMKNKPFITNYTPTPTMQSSDFVWKPLLKDNENIKITVWDIVPEAIRDSETDPNITLPDATNVDTYGHADGVMVIYNPRIEESVDYAISIIQAAPQELPIALLANFLDQRQNHAEYHHKLKPYQDRICHIQTSMQSNQGLVAVAKWLELPFLYSRKTIYETSFKAKELEMDLLSNHIQNLITVHDSKRIPINNDSEEEEIMIPMEFQLNEKQPFSIEDEAKLRSKNDYPEMNTNFVIKVDIRK